MQIPLIIRKDLVKKAIRLPRLRPVWYRNGFPKTVELQTATADRVHDGRVVDNLEGDPLFLGPQHQICVRRRAEGVAHDKEGDVFILRVVEDIVCALLHQITVGNEQTATIELFLDKRTVLVT